MDPNHPENKRIADLEEYNRTIWDMDQLGDYAAMHANENALLNEMLSPGSVFGCGISNVTQCNEYCDVAIADLHPSTVYDFECWTMPFTTTMNGTITT